MPRTAKAVGTASESGPLLSCAATPPLASILHSNGDTLDIAVKDGRIVGVRAVLIAPPPGELYSETNDNSVAILLSYGTARVLLAGDAEAREEEYEWLRKQGVNEYRPPVELACDYWDGRIDGPDYSGGLAYVAEGVGLAPHASASGS